MTADSYYNTGPDSIDDEGGPAFDADSALDYLYRSASPLEHARLAHWRGGDPEGTGLWRALSRYQNPDGGWSHGVDPDYTGDPSSIQSTIEALRILVVHGQADDQRVAVTMQFLRQHLQPDGSWQERDEVLKAGAPSWYAPAKFRVWETAMLAGYGLELGFTDFWSPGAQYVRSVWADLQKSLPHPYWASVLLFGRSSNDKDRQIVQEAVGALTQFARRNRIDPYDCSWIIEVVSILEIPGTEDLVVQLGDKLAASQDTDGGVITEYGDHLKPKATFNALMAVAALHQYVE